MSERELATGEIDCVKAAYRSSQDIFKKNSTHDAWTILIQELVEAGVVDNLSVEQCENIIHGNNIETSSDVSKVENKKITARRTWTISETKSLLNSYRDREHEFNQIRKKKDAWENVVQDLELANVLDSPVSGAQCETKVKSLFRAYKATIDREKLTGIGATTSKCLLFDEMNEIFGNRPIISGAETVSVGVTEVIKIVGATPKKNDGKLINRLKLYTPNSKKPDRLNLEKFKQEKKDNRFKEKTKMYMELDENKQRRHDEKLNMERRKLEILEKLSGNLPN